MFLPIVMRPAAPDPAVVPGWAATMAQAPVCVISGPRGSYLPESLAGAVRSWGRWEQCVWLRAPHPPCTPPRWSLEDCLQAACLQRWGGAPEAPGDRGPRPAPGAGAEPASALRRAPTGSVVVVEFSGPARRLRHLVQVVRPALIERRTVLVLALDGRRWWGPRGTVDRWVGADDLARDMCLGAANGLDGIDLEHLMRLAGRRLSVVHDTLAFARLGAVDLVADALARAGSWRHLLDLLAARLLAGRTTQEREAIEICLSYGYWHPQLTDPPVTGAELSPWLIPLDDGWVTLRRIWAGPLTRHLAGTRAAPPPTRPPQPQERPPATVDRQTSAHAVRPPSRRTVRLDTHLLQARLLGAIEVRVDGVPVARWRGQRGVGLLRLLLFRRGHACLRDELLAEFWPDVPPRTARNRLQVAVSGLRRDLAAVTPANLVQYADLRYAIAANVQVRTDVEEFEELLPRAAAALRRGDREQAEAAYLDCAALYRGDFAADAPYEQWTLLPRESLRLRYLEVLERLSRLQWSAGRTTECIATAQRMLESDPCREDAHRLIMSCHAGLGHTYQAFQQFESCCRVLRVALDADPCAETVALYRRIRDGKPPGPPVTGPR